MQNSVKWWNIGIQQNTLNNLRFDKVVFKIRYNDLK